MDYKIGIVILKVSDVSKARKFYGETLAMPVIEEQSGDQFVMLRTATGFMGLEPVSADWAAKNGQPGAVEIGFEVEDVDATYKEWKNKGVHLLREPHDQPFGRIFEALDPDGHPLSVYKFAGR